MRPHEIGGKERVRIPPPAVCHTKLASKAAGLRPRARRTTRGIEEPRTPGRKKCFGRKDGEREPVEDLVCGGTSLRRSPGNLG